MDQFDLHMLNVTFTAFQNAIQREPVDLSSLINSARHLDLYLSLILSKKSKTIIYKIFVTFLFRILLG